VSPPAEKAARASGDEAAQAAAKAIDAVDVFELTEAVVAEHDVVVFTAGSRDELLRWNAFCRNFSVVVGSVRGEDQVVPRPIKFIATAVAGASGYLFSDFGPGFMCSDHDGEPPVVRHVRLITNEKEVCACVCVPRFHGPGPVAWLPFTRPAGLRGCWGGGGTQGVLQGLRRARAWCVWLGWW
jgi:hypothetical protein